MKKNIVRLLVLSALILLCIWQTNTLWLGDMSSHNFFEAVGHNTYEQYYVYPKQIWAVNKFAYNIGGANREEGKRYQLITELTNELKRDNVQISDDVKLTYANLLSTEGIVYEYGTSLGLNELAGKEITIKKKIVDIPVQNLFVDLSASDNYRTYVYIIDPEGNVNYMLTLNNKLSAHVDTLKHFTQEEYKYQRENTKEYQASLLNNRDNEAFKGNIFYPMNSEESPIAYENILFRPVIIKGEEDKLSNMVNCLFTNPLYKKKNIIETGVTFNDNLNLNVKYENIGTLEFKKSTIDSTNKLTAVQRMNKVCTFIKETTAIPEKLKEGLYLNGISKNPLTGEVTYTFGFVYENLDVILSDHIKEQLDVRAYVELVLKDDEIIRGKWLMLEPETINNEKGAFAIQYDEILNKIQEERMDDEKKLSMLECAYTLNSLDDILSFGWVYEWAEK